jgi:transposase
LVFKVLQEATNPVRVTTLFRKLIAVTSLFSVTEVSLERRGLVLQVKPRWRKPRCGRCGKVAPGYDQRPLRYWRHLAFARSVIWLAYAPRRVKCQDCSVTTEEVPWAAHDSRFTWDIEEMTAYLAQITDKTTVTQLVGVSWRTVGQIVERVVERNLDDTRLDDLGVIGVDEFSYRKRHNYLTTVVDHERRRVIWAAPGRNADVLIEFFKELGIDRCFNIKTVTMDMSASYEKAVQLWLPQADIVFDRFHVQQLASDAVDEVRRAIVRELKGTEDAKTVKKTRFVLLKNQEDLSRPEKQKLNAVQANNKRLYRAYLLKETLRNALDYLQPARAEKELRSWLSWASRSRLAPFVRVARTIRARLEGVLAYVRTRLTNGFLEGINNKTRVVARRAYGFHGPAPLIAMLFLNCGGIELDPPLP